MDPCCQQLFRKLWMYFILNCRQGQSLKNTYITIGYSNTKLRQSLIFCEAPHSVWADEVAAHDSNPCRSASCQTSIPFWLACSIRASICTEAFGGHTWMWASRHLHSIFLRGLTHPPLMHTSLAKFCNVHHPGTLSVIFSPGFIAMMDAMKTV